MIIASDVCLLFTTQTVDEGNLEAANPNRPCSIHSVQISVIQTSRGEQTPLLFTRVGWAALPLLRCLRRWQPMCPLFRNEVTL